MIIAPITAAAMTGLTITATTRGHLLTWDALDDAKLFAVEVWASKTNDRSTATKKATVFDTTFMHLTKSGETWYHWIRTVSIYKRADGPWLPTSSTGGTASTSLLATSTTIAQSNSALTQSAYGAWENVFVLSFMGTGNTFLIDAQHLANVTLTTIGTSQTAYAQQRLSLVKNTLYTTGTVGVTNGSAIVTGLGTNWAGNVAAGQKFMLPNGTRYTISTVDSATQITLTVAYGGATASGQAYQIITASVAEWIMTQTTDKFEISGSYCLNHTLPFGYRVPTVCADGFLYDCQLDWILQRDNTSWALSNSSVLKTLILEEIRK